MTTLWAKICQFFSSMGASQEKSDYERYLNGATDVHELEARERAWDRNRSRGLF